MLKKRQISLFGPIIGIACLLCSCTVNLNDEKLIDFAETKDITFFLDNNSPYFPTERLDTVSYDDLSEIEASSLSIHDIVVITNIDNTYVFSDSDISGINTMFEQGTMVVFINFQDSFYDKYIDDFAAMGINFSSRKDLAVLSIFYLNNGEMLKEGYSFGSDAPQDNTIVTWQHITDAVMDMYEDLAYVQ